MFIEVENIMKQNKYHAKLQIQNYSCLMLLCFIVYFILLYNKITTSSQEKNELKTINQRKYQKSCFKL